MKAYVEVFEDITGMWGEFRKTDVQSWGARTTGNVLDLRIYIYTHTYIYMKISASPGSLLIQTFKYFSGHV